MDKLKALAVFVAIADEGSLTAAAEAQDMSLPAVVRSLQSLEAHLGVRLFQRTTRRIALTAEGRSYLDRSRAVLAAVDDADAAVTQEAQAPRGRVVVTAPVMFGQLHVAPAVRSFLAEHEAVQVQLLLLDRVVNLLEEGVDVGVRIGQLEDSTLISSRVGSLRRLVVATPRFWQEHGVPRHPRDLLRMPCVLFTAATGPWWVFHEKGKSFQVPVRGNLDVNHAGAAVDAVLAGAGVGMFIEYQVRKLVADKKLAVALTRFEPPPRPIQIVVPQARLLPSRTSSLVKHLQRALRTSTA